MTLFKSRQHQQLLIQQLLQLYSTPRLTRCTASGHQIHHHQGINGNPYVNTKYGHFHTCSGLTIPRGRTSHYGDGTATKTMRLHNSFRDGENMKSPGKETDVPLVGIDERGLSGTYVLGKERHPSDDRFSNEDLQNQQQRYSHNFSDVSYRQQKDEIQRDLAADSLVKHAKKSYKSLPSERTRRGSLQAGLLQGTVDEQRLHNDEGWKGQVTKVRDQRSSSQRPDKWGADSRQDDGWFKSKAKHGARMVGEKSSRTLKQQASSSTTDDHSQTVDARIMSPKISEAFPGAQEVISEKRTFDPGWGVKAHGRDDGWQNGGNKSNKKESTKGKGKKTKTKKSKDGTESKR